MAELECIDCPIMWVNKLSSPMVIGSRNMLLTTDFNWALYRSVISISGLYNTRGDTNWKRNEENAAKIVSSRHHHTKAKPNYHFRAQDKTNRWWNEHMLNFFTFSVLKNRKSLSRTRRNYVVYFEAWCKLHFERWRQWHNPGKERVSRNTDKCISSDFSAISRWVLMGRCADAVIGMLLF